MHRLFFVLILLIATNGFAADVDHLYQSEKAVSSQSEAEREAVSADVLRQVLLKVVGDSSLLKRADVSAILAQSNTLVKQYEYQRTNVIADDLTEPDRLEVLLTFDQSAVNKGLETAGLPIWGSSRPEILVWLAIEKADERQIMSADDQTEFMAALTQSAHDRGLPILIPVMDLEDQSKVTFADISADFSQTVEAASQRYGSKVVLMALAKQLADGTVNIRWHALINDASEHWQSRGDITTAMTAGVDELSNRLSRQFAQRMTQTESDDSLSLFISGITDYQDYMRVVNYLKTVESASNIQVTNLAGDSLELTMKFSGDRDVLSRTLSIDKVLAEEAYSPNEAMNLRLLP